MISWWRVGAWFLWNFIEPGEFAGLPQKVVVNATGYGARALWKDESIVPVRGQIAWLIPQAEVNYGLGYKGLNVLGSAGWRCGAGWRQGRDGRVQRCQ
jgi:glycine/D-amino acid oxidase-like deaminating enzyme